MPPTPMPDARDASPPRARQPLVPTVKAFVVRWVALNWLDCLCMLVLAGVTFGVYHSPVPVTRTFPITFNGSGDIIFPEWAYPYRGWIVPSWASGVASIGGPIIVYVAAQVRIKSIWDASCAIMGSIWAVLLASLFQVIVKQLIGGFRPYFLDVCMPDLSLASRNETGLNAVGFQKIMYTTEVCTQPDAMKLKTAITSFPSGHSTATWAGFGFLFLWMNAKLKVWADHRPAFWKLSLTLLPVLVSVCIACSLTIDAAHNWYDIVAGSVIGAVMALAAYRASYAAVWDWRFNHIPLQPKEAFPYSGKGDAYLAAHTFTRSVGWGARRERPGPGMDSARSSGAFAHPRGEAQRVGDEATGGEGNGRSKRQPLTMEEAV
ncbi:PAP2 superfamily protein [Hirsutella rhossiliensis]|uniref:PAP2 superfamily domain-containing protein n=1 Tax=Hirsutella rhossiliensis TaxID=111463 RepID=A0A9P8MYR0_9HYPO|nr:PAP2 superfamily domain-containing protein [Hirsutella rhossiliensis]KAH0963684.1 PAP2 superfamily domain-containing protein [Hirsutella rhossiliensis]